MITPESLLTAVNMRRLDLAAERGSVDPLSFLEVAEAIGVHSAMFSRLKNGVMPSKANIAAILEWIGDEKLAHCPTCPDEAEELDLDAEEELEEAEVTEGDTDSDGDEETDKPQINAIYAIGALSNSDDPETQAAVARVRELLAEGAVGVSVALDGHPDDVKTISEAPFDEETGEPQLPENFVMRQRLRHTAIVDTPAFSEARLRENEDGSLEGEIVFEGVYTGDGRTIELDSIDLDAGNLPHPIIWDRQDGDHTGTVVGYITSVERREAKTSVSARTILDDEAITASLAPMEFPKRYFMQTSPTKAEPMRISKPDANGYRMIYGLAAPNGVCIRNSMKCWTWPGDKDKSHRHFHTGTLLRLDDGSDIRVGALTIGGAHLDGALARQGVTAKDTSNYRDNANRIFALVRVWESRFGLMMTGVIPPDVTEGDIARALACSPSIEFWPENGGRTLVGLHLVPTPGLPVLASSGSAQHFVTDLTIEMEEDDEAEAMEEPDVSTPDLTEFADKVGEFAAQLTSLEAKVDELLSKVGVLMELTPIEDIEIPE